MGRGTKRVRDMKRVDDAVSSLRMLSYSMRIIDLKRIIDVKRIIEVKRIIDVKRIINVKRTSDRRSYAVGRGGVARSGRAGLGHRPAAARGAAVANG